MYLPKGIEPNRLIHYACLSPDALLKYVLEWQEQHHDAFCVDLAFFFSEIAAGNLIEDVTVDSDLPPKTLWDSVYDEWQRFYASAHPLNTMAIATYVHKGDARTTMSISWVEVLFHLDELLQHPYKWPLGWLGLCMLPIVKTYSPACFEFILGKVYRSLADDTDLHNAALEAENQSKERVINYSTFRLLLTDQFITSQFIYDGIDNSRDREYLRKLKHSKVKRDDLVLPKSSATMSSLIHSQLTLCIPASRNNHHGYTGGLADSLKDISFDLSLGLAFSSNYERLTPYYINTVEQRAYAYCNHFDPQHPQRRDTFYMLLEHILKCSLKRNREFLSHIIYSLDLVMGYESKASIRARKKLLDRFSSVDTQGKPTYWCIPSSTCIHNYKEVTSYTRSWAEKDSTLFLPESPETITETALYTVDITNFLATYRTLDVALSRYDSYNVMRFSSPILTALSASVWKFLPMLFSNSAHNPLMFPANESRNSKEYFTAYTYSLALAVGEWIGSATTACKLLNISKETRPGTASLIPLAYDSGVSSLVPLWKISDKGDIEEYRWVNCVANIDIPQYLIFLSQFSFFGNLYHGVVSALTHLRLQTTSYASVFCYRDHSDYTRFIKYLRTHVFTDLFDYRCFFVPNESTGNNTLFMAGFRKERKHAGSTPQGFLTIDDWAISLTVPSYITWAKQHTNRVSHFVKERLYARKIASPVKKLKSEVKRAPRTEKILSLDCKLSDGRVIPVKMLKRRYETYYVLPWRQLFNLGSIQPPIPTAVYSRRLSERMMQKMATPVDRVEKRWGLYMDYLAWAKDSNPKHTWESVLAFWNQSTDREKLALNKGVLLLKNHGYAFSLTFLQGLTDGNWVEKRSISAIIPELMDFLIDKSVLSVDNITSQITVQKRKEYEATKRKKFLDKVRNTVEGRHLGIKDTERLRFTEADDNNIKRYYHIGMTREEQDKLKELVLHSWDNIMYRASYLCEKLIKAGVVDPKLLPIRRVTKKVKQAIEAT